MLLTVVTGAGPPSTPFRSVVMRAHLKRGVSALREVFEREPPCARGRKVMGCRRSSRADARGAWRDGRISSCANVLSHSCVTGGAQRRPAKSKDCAMAGGDVRCARWGTLRTRCSHHGDGGFKRRSGSALSGSSPHREATAARACAGAAGEARAQNRIESSSVLVGMSWGLSSLHVPCREPQREGGWAGG